MSIPTGLLPSLRRMSERTLPDTCAIVRVTTVPNDSGGWTETTATASTVACRLGPLGGRERVLGGRVVEESDAVLTLPYDADVRGSDRITRNGTTYEIVDIVERSEPLMTRIAVKATT